MFCPNCGNKIEEGFKFCSSCGTPVETEVSVEAEASVETDVPVETEAAAVNEDIVEEPVETEALVKEETPVNVVPPVQPQMVTQPQKPKKAFDIKKALIAIAAVIVVVIAGVLFLGNMPSSGEAVVYVKKDKLYFKDNINSKKEASEVVDLDSETEYPNYYTLFSKNREYLYFFTEVDSSNCGTLNRIKISDIKADKEKNEDKIQEIESHVQTWSIEAVGDEGVLYCTQNKRLEYYNGKDSIRISKECNDFAYDEKNNAVIYFEWNDEADSYDVYAGVVSDDMDPEKIDDHIVSMYSYANADFIVYSKDDGKELYEAGIGRDPEKITNELAEMSGVDSEQKKIIYCELVEKTVPLYEFVEDDCLANDEALQAPNVMNFATEVGLDIVLDQDNYEYYSEYPEDLAYFYDSLWEDRDIGMKYFYNSDNETFYYYNGTSWYHIDEDAYGQAVEAYESVDYRVRLREALKENTYSSSLQNVYYYESGKDAELLLEDVSSVVVGDVETKLISYQKGKINKVKLSEISSVRDVYYFVENAYEWETYCQVYDGKAAQLDFGRVSNIVLSDDKTKCALQLSHDEMNELFVCDINGNELWVVESLTDEQTPLMYAWMGNTLYYVKDVDNGSGDLCKYANATAERVIKNVGVSSIIIDEEENCLAFEYDDGDYDVELYDSKHEKVEKFSNFRLVKYIAKDKIVYLKNEKLCVYDGSDETKEIDKNVDYVDIYVNPEEVTRTITVY